MSHNYDADEMFGSNDNDQTQQSYEDDYDVEKWTLGDHTARPTVSKQQLETDAARVAGIDDELADILNAAAAKVPDASLGDFECAACGLNHGHDDQKHDIRDSFDVTTQFAELMEFNPACHCGVNELAMLVDFYDDIETRMFSDEASLSTSERKDRFGRIRSAAESATLANTTEERIESIRAGLDAEFGDDPDASPGVGDVNRGP